MNSLQASDYHSQRNNSHKPYYECGNTSLANLLCSKDYSEELRGYDFPLDDYIYEWLRGPLAQGHAKTIGAWAMRTPEQVPEMLRFAAEKLSEFPHKLSWTVSKEDILKNFPLVVPTDFYKKQKNGHYVMVGFADKEGVIVNDPFGDPLTDYENKKGYGVKIPWEVFLNNFHGIGIYKG